MQSTETPPPAFAGEGLGGGGRAGGGLAGRVLAGGGFVDGVLAGLPAAVTAAGGTLAGPPAGTGPAELAAEQDKIGAGPPAGLPVGPAPGAGAHSATCSLASTSVLGRGLASKVAGYSHGPVPCSQAQDSSWVEPACARQRDSSPAAARCRCIPHSLSKGLLPELLLRSAPVRQVAEKVLTWARLRPPRNGYCKICGMPRSLL